MKIYMTSVMVEDQEKALQFYTDVLRFEKRTDLPMGEFRWLTVASSEGPSDVELLLEPNAFPPAKIFQRALFDAGIPLASFAVSDLHEEYERLKGLGVVFRMEPTQMGPVSLATFEDTCGNLIQLAQK